VGQGDAARQDCSARGGVFSAAGCPESGLLGACVVPSAGGPERLVTVGDQVAACLKVQQGCTNITGGEFTAEGPCVAALAGGGDFSFPSAVPASRVCRPPLPGEPPGKSEGGQVCTWQWISGNTEEGRRFSDYADCDAVRRQRPYEPLPPSRRLAEADSRLADPAYAAEVSWARAQADASGCSCCHRASVTPQGPAVWDTEAGGNWANSFSAYGLAFAAGVLDSHLLGSYPAADNNGFARDLGTSRDLPGIPSTDPARMKRFFLGELEHRGLPLERFSVERPTPGFADQLDTFQPGPCGPESGVGSDGVIRWGGPPARYVYVLEVGSKNPNTPPNLDTPAGTIWRLDAPFTGDAFLPGSVVYGKVPSGAAQAFPTAGAPAALSPGKSYYLYVQLDLDVPVERCLFTF
jgi:hypothetical protein